MQKIIDIILLQKRELEKRLAEEYVERETQFKNSGDLIKVILGPRRAGKSFFSIHALNKSGDFGYVNFDDEKLAETEDYNDIINAVNSVYNNPKHILFDEIQNLNKWELFVNKLQRQGYKLVITGSNSNLLSKELSTHLTGRHTRTTILPFSFKEFLGLSKAELTESEIKKKLSDYIVYGGYPEPLLKGLDYKDYLSTLFSSVIYKDIVKRFRIRLPSIIENLGMYLISNISKEFSCNSLSKAVGFRSVHTVGKYIGYLEESFIFFRLNRFSFKLKEQMSANNKMYCIDNGFIHAKAFKFMPEIGRMYENTVAVELLRQSLSNNGMEIYYWKNQQQEEVDFVVKAGLKIRQLIQVCYNMDDLKTKQREIRSLLKAGKETGCKDLVMITENQDTEEAVDWFGISGRIRYIPLWKWLLEGVKFSES